jgi:large subunit ribosomal protein L5
MARLRDQYKSEIRPRLARTFGIGNLHAVPELRKITVSAGVGNAKENKKALEHAVKVLEKVTGQKAVVTKARVSVAQFRLRSGMPVGVKVTLRGVRMYEFLDRLINVVTPRIRDFRGLRRELDGSGNYSMGIHEQSVFPEVDTDLLETPQGMNVTMTISGGSDERSAALLEAFGFPFRREEAQVG